MTLWVGIQVAYADSLRDESRSGCVCAHFNISTTAHEPSREELCGVSEHPVLKGDVAEAICV